MRKQHKVIYSRRQSSLFECLSRSGVAGRNIKVAIRRIVFRINSAARKDPHATKGNLRIFAKHQNLNALLYVLAILKDNNGGSRYRRRHIAVYLSR
jgi:hypothetical protein